MRVLAHVVLAALLLAPSVAAVAQTNDHFYVVTGMGGFGGGGILIENGETYFPDFGNKVTVDVDDALRGSVYVQLCHEWTYDDGSHPTVGCVHACTHIEDPLRWPPAPYQWNTTYRVWVDLRQGPGACVAKPVAGSLHVTFS